MSKTNRKGKSKVLDTNQLDNLISNLPQKHHKLIASICRNTACRISEACQLKWEDLRPDKYYPAIYFPKEITVKYFISVDEYKKTTPIDFRIECVFDQNKTVLTPILTKKPDFIKNARLNSNQVQLIILE